MVLRRVGHCLTTIGKKTEALPIQRKIKPYRGMIDMKRLILGVAGALMLGAGQAAADGLPSRGAIRGPVAAAAPAWTGLYLGAGVGGGVLEFDAGADGNGDGGGVLGTVVLGYDYKLGSRWVAGVFGDFDFSGISANVDTANGPFDVDHHFSWSVGGRLGALVTPTTLLYGTGGYTQAEFEANNITDNADGFFVGGGVETVLRDNWTLKLEYRFQDFGDNDGADLSMHTGRAVLSYRFPTY